MSRERLDYLMRALISAVCAVLLTYVAWIIVSRFFSILVLLAVATLVAYLINPLVDRLSRIMWRPLAVLLSYAAIAGVLVGGGYLLFGPVVRQLSAAVASLPSKNAQIEAHLREIDSVLARHGVTLHLAQSQDKIIAALQAQGGTLVTRTLAIASSVASLLLDALLCLVMSIYLVLDGRGIHDRIFRLIPDRYRERAFFVEAAVNTVVGGYVRGQVILEVTIGTLAGVGCWWLGLPYPALLGITAAILELVPMLGPMLASVPPILLALTSAHPVPLALKVLLYFFVIQQFETNVLGPRITGHAVGLHPLGAIVALLVGANLGGALGAIVAAPLAGLLYVLAAAIYWHFTGQSAPKRRASPIVRAGTTIRRRTRREEVVSTVVTVEPSQPPARVAAVEQARDELVARFEEDLAKESETEATRPLRAAEQPESRRDAG